MAAGNLIRLVFERFAGDWLGMGSLQAGEGQFSGHNVHVYENGSVGERPGWEERTWSGAPPTDEPLKGITWFKGTSAYGELIVATEDASNIDVRQYTVLASGDMSATADSATFSESTSPDPPSVWGQSWPNEKLFPMFSDTSTTVGVGSRFYEDFSATSYTANLGSGYASGSIVYRDRVFYWGFDNFPGRVYYSDAADFNTVQATSWFDVGPNSSLDGQGVIGAWNIRDAIIFARRDGVWMAMYGTNPDDGVLREIGQGVIPDHGVAVADMDNQLWFLKPNGSGVAHVTPSGLNVEEYDMARPGRDLGDESGTPIGGPENQQGLRSVADLANRSLVLPYVASPTITSESTVYFLNRINGKWIQESFTHDTNINEVDFTMMGDGVMAMVIRDTTPSYHLFTRRIVLNRPARDTGDNFANQLSDETTPTPAIVLPEIPAPGEGQIRLREVLVDFDYWQQTTEFDAPSFDVEVLSKGADVSGGAAQAQEVAGTTVSVDGSSWPDTTDSDTPSRRREQATFGTSPYAAWIQVKLTNLSSVAIRRVQVALDLQESPR